MGAGDGMAGSKEGESFAHLATSTAAALKGAAVAGHV
jgi:hypothetical protein